MTMMAAFESVLDAMENDEARWEIAAITAAVTALAAGLVAASGDELKNQNLNASKDSAADAGGRLQNLRDRLRTLVAASATDRAAQPAEARAAAAPRTSEEIREMAERLIEVAHGAVEVVDAARQSVADTQRRTASLAALATGVALSRGAAEAALQAAQLYLTGLDDDLARSTYKAKISGLFQRVRRAEADFTQAMTLHSPSSG